MEWVVWVSILVGYLIGSIPCGYLIGRYGKGIDIRLYGSGNIGTTNAFRILGPQWGALVFVGDFLKGALAVLLAQMLAGGLIIPILTGLAVIAGHNWSIFLGFRGGRGVATAGGVILALAPIATLVLAIIFFLTLLITRYVSLSSVTTAVAAPFVMGWFGHSWGLALFGLIAAAFVIYRHLPNLKRLRNGTEPRIGRASYRW
jgi:glycerol-3-phosphate acyltransferase PlsY